MVGVCGGGDRVRQMVKGFSSGWAFGLKLFNGLFFVEGVKKGFNLVEAISFFPGCSRNKLQLFRVKKHAKW